MSNLIIETAGTEEEAIEGLESALGMEVVEVGVSTARENKRVKRIKGLWEP